MASNQLLIGLFFFEVFSAFFDASEFDSKSEDLAGVEIDFESVSTKGLGWAVFYRALLVTYDQ